MRTSPRFRAALRKIRSTPVSVKGDARRAFYTGINACLVHGSPARHHIGIDLRCDLRLIERVLSSPLCPTSCPILYLIPPVPAGVVRSDSSLSAAGGYCSEAKFWWYLEWLTQCKTTPSAA